MKYLAFALFCVVLLFGCPVSSPQGNDNTTNTKIEELEQTIQEIDSTLQGRMEDWVVYEENPDTISQENSAEFLTKIQDILDMVDNTQCLEIIRTQRFRTRKNTPVRIFYQTGPAGQVSRGNEEIVWYHDEHRGYITKGHGGSTLDGQTKEIRRRGGGRNSRLDIESELIQNYRRSFPLMEICKVSENDYRFSYYSPLRGKNIVFVVTHV